MCLPPGVWVSWGHSHKVLNNRALVKTTWDSERKALAHSLGYRMWSLGSHCYHCRCWHFVSHGRLEAFDGHYLAVVTPDCRIPVHHLKGFGGLCRLAFLKCFWRLVYWSFFSLVRLTWQRRLKEEFVWAHSLRVLFVIEGGSAVESSWRTTRHLFLSHLKSGRREIWMPVLNWLPPLSLEGHSLWDGNAHIRDRLSFLS